MFTTIKVKIFLISCLSIVFLLVTFSSGESFGQEASISEIKGKINNITDKERETLKKLFNLTQEIEKIEKEEDAIVNDIGIIQKEAEDLQRSISDEEASYAKKKEGLKQLLKSYQRMGPGSYLEIILSSDSLPELLARINTLRDITRNTQELLVYIQKSSEKQAAEKAKLSEKLVLMQEKKKRLGQALAEGKKHREDMESYLASLSKEREHYQKNLDMVHSEWEGLKPSFAKAIKEFSSYIENGDLPQDAFEFTNNFFISFNVSIDDKTLNEILEADPRFKVLAFRFYNETAELRMPEKNLVLVGKFIILDKHSLKFEVDDGTFYGMQLDEEAIKQLFREGELVFNLKQQLFGFSIISLEHVDGYLKFSTGFE